MGKVGGAAFLGVGYGVFTDERRGTEKVVCRGGEDGWGENWGWWEG